MAHDFELVDNAIANELKRAESYSGATKQPGRGLLRLGILTLGVLCILQGALNVSLRLALYTKDDTDQLPDNILSISDMSQIENSTQLCSCCHNLLRKLIKEYQELKKERDNLAIQLNYDYFFPEDSGSGYWEN